MKLALEVFNGVGPISPNIALSLAVINSTSIEFHN